MRPELSPFTRLHLSAEVTLRHYQIKRASATQLIMRRSANQQAWHEECCQLPSGVPARWARVRTNAPVLTTCA